VAVAGLHVCKHEAERGLAHKNQEIECDGSILGAPCEIAAEHSGERWWGSVDEVVAVAQPCIWQHKGVGFQVW